MTDMTDNQKIDRLIEEHRNLRHYVAEEIGHMRITINALEARMTEFARHDFQLSCRVDNVCERLSTLEETLQTKTPSLSDNYPVVTTDEGIEPFVYKYPGLPIQELALVEAVLDLNDNHNLSSVYSQLYRNIARIVEKGDELDFDFASSQFIVAYKAYYESNVLKGKVLPPSEEGKYDTAIYEAFHGVNCDASENLPRSYLDLLTFICGTWFRKLMHSECDVQEFREALVKKANLYKEAIDPKSELRKRAETTFRIEGKLK